MAEHRIGVALPRLHQQRFIEMVCVERMPIARANVSRHGKVHCKVS
jgi:hypothetical protein